VRFSLSNRARDKLRKRTYVRDCETTTHDARCKKIDEEKKKNREREREKRERKRSFSLVRWLRTDISFMIRRVHTPRKSPVFCMNLRQYAEQNHSVMPATPAGDARGVAVA